MAQATDDSALATRWKTRIKEALSYWDKDFKRVERMRALAGGKDVDNPSDKTRRVNLIHSTIKGLLPHVYARLPEIAIQPKESMDKSEYEMLRSFATTLEIVLNELLEAAKLKHIAKAATRRVFSEGIAWAKVGWQRDIKQDPIILNRIADTQDNILQLQRLITELQGQDTSTHEAKLEELHQLQKSLEDAVEIVVSDGLVIDLLTAENVILDPAIASLEDWDKSRYIIHEVLLPLDTAKAQYPDASFSATATNDEARPVTLAAPTSLQNNDRTRANERMVKIWEVWDKTTMTVYTLSDEVVDYVREPYQPEIVSEDWYPFYPLAFEITDSRVYPFSVTELLEPLQAEYLETREKYALHRKRAIPMMGVRKDAVLPEDARKINEGELLEMVRLEGSPDGKPVQNELGFIPYPPIDGSLYDTSAIRFDVEMMSGLQDAQRGAIARPKTATEAEVMQSGLTSRVTEMQDTIEDWIEQIATAGAELALWVMTKSEVERIAGRGAVWPELDKETIYRFVKVSIRSGTSGKPNKSQEQRNWAQVVPLAMQLMQSVMQAEKMGESELANAQRELLAETLRRLDERFDVDRLLPKLSMQPTPQNTMQQALPPEAMQLLAQQGQTLPAN